MARGLFPVSVLFFFMIPVMAQAQVQEKITTLDQALRHVYVESPALQAERFSLKSVHELYPQALGGYHPVIGAEASVVSSHIDTGRRDVADGTTTKGMSLVAEQPLYRGGRTSAEVGSAKNIIQASYNRMLEAEQSVFLRTVESYMNVIRDRMLINYQAQNVEALSRQTDSLKARYEAQDITLTDLRRAESRLAEARAQQVAAAGAMRASEALFEEVVGLPPSHDLTLPENIPAIPRTVREMVEKAQMNNPSLFVSRYEHRAAQDEIGIAQSDRYPQLTAFASHVKEYDPQPGIIDESDTSTIGLRARINLYEGGRTMSRIREAKNRANQRYIEIRETERKVVRDLTQNWNLLQSYKAEINAREEEVSAGIFTAEGLREEVRLGERTIVEVLDAERDLLNSRIGLANARRNMVVTSYQLAASLGMLLPEHMGMAELAYDPGPHYRAVAHRYFSSDEN